MWKMVEMEEIDLRLTETTDIVGNGDCGWKQRRHAVSTTHGGNKDIELWNPMWHRWIEAKLTKKERTW